jgi:anti-sigma regulatory factor (Ser/Thr protein kinase)
MVVARNQQYAFAASSQAPARARASLATAADSVPRPILEDLQLIASELVTNSLRHAGLAEDDEIRLRLSILPGTVRLEVHDRDEPFSVTVQAGRAGGDSGWGLYIVDRLADRWGMVENDGVWIEIDLPPNERVPA